MEHEEPRRRGDGLGAASLAQHERWGKSETRGEEGGGGARCRTTTGWATSAWDRVMTHATVAGTVRGSRRLGPLYQRGTRGEGGGTSRGFVAERHDATLSTAVHDIVRLAPFCRAGGGQARRLPGRRKE